MFGMLGMDVDGNQAQVETVMERKNKRERKREKRRAELEARKWAGTYPATGKAGIAGGKQVAEGAMIMDDSVVEARKEEDFEKFLQGVGADMDEEL